MATESRPGRHGAGGSGEGPRIGPLRSLDELAACVELQEEVWGADFSERVPAAILKIAARLGGVSAGAFDDEDRLVGFVFGLTGLEDGRPVHWSHMLAVRAGLRGSGIGRRLKAHQREVLLGRGVTRCYWTFDPLEGRNGWLNTARLGAVVREYLPDMYGETDSPLHGVGTDRFLAVWEMDSERVRERLAGRGAPEGSGTWAELPRAFDVEVSGGLPRPAGAHRIPPEPEFVVPVPLDLQELLKRDPALARRWREVTRAALVEALDGTREVRETLRAGRDFGAYLVVTA